MFAVSGAYMAAIEEWLSQHGYGRSGLCQRIRRLHRDEQVAVEEAVQLLAEAARISGQPLAALAIGQCIGGQHLGVMGHALANVRTLEEMLSSYVFYERLFYGSNLASVRRSDEGMELYWSVPAVPPHYARYAMSSFVAVVRNAGLPARTIYRVSFPFEDRANLEFYLALLGDMQVKFRARLGVAFTRASLQLATRVVASTETRERFVAVHLAPLDDGELAQRLYDEILAALPRGDANLRVLSQRLAMSPRTLQRRLAGLSDGLRGLVLALRMHLACVYLQDPSLTLSAVSLLLGYSEQSAFQLAFKRYHGETPGRWRHRSVRGRDVTRAHPEPRRRAR